MKTVSIILKAMKIQQVFQSNMLYYTLSLLILVLVILIYNHSKIIIQVPNYQNDLINFEQQSIISVEEPTINTININTYTFIIKPGDTLIGLLTKTAIDKNIIYSIINKLKKHYNKNIKLSQGRRIVITTEIIDNKIDLRSLIIDINDRQIIEVIKQNNTYNITTQKHNYQTQISKISGIVKNNFFSDAKQQGISANIIMKLVKLYEHEIDFQREIRTGTKFNVLLENYYNDYGELSKNNSIVYTSLDNGNNKFEFYRHITKDGRHEYFTKNGIGIQKTLLKTPIDGARISSKFGKRIHPIYGYSKMHKGVDFAAPIGTKIYAAGKGTIEYVGTRGGYGKYIKIKHDKNYSTAYAHISRYKPKLKNGSKVKQGEVIAYVGKTGKATGPHLHYEVIYKGNQIDPIKAKSLAKLTLNGQELDKFKLVQIDIQKHLDQGNDSLYASREDINISNNTS